jgi:hypothetical protein
MNSSKGSILISLTGLIFWALSVALLLGPYSTAMVLAQGVCDKELADAEQRFYEGRFDEAIDLVNRCLNKSGLTDVEKVRAYKLMTMAYQAKDYEFQAREAINKLLELVPNYEPDPEQDLPQYVELVRKVKEELQQAQVTPQPTEPQKPAEPVTTAPPKKKRGVPWLLIGGGVGVAAVAAAVLAGGGGGNGPPPPPPQPLPIPPDLP